MERKGMWPIVLSRKVELLPQAAPIYSGFFEIDRDGFNGRPQFAGMCLVLDELGIRDPEERKRWRSIWREMSHTESEVREKQAEKRKKKEEAKRTGRGAEE